MRESLLLRLCIAIVPLCLIAGCATYGVSAPERRNSERTVTPLDRNWHFLFEGEDADGQPPTQEAGWQVVALPHSWNRLGEYRLERTDATDKRQGKGWYRRAIDGTTLDPARRHFIEFEAVGNVADLWVNGVHAGRHAGAFSRFRFELTDLIDYSGENRLLLRADNAKPEPGSTTEHVIPLLGDFFIHGGIYRPARLISVASSHISLSDYGGPGVYADVAERGENAEIDVLARLTDAREGQRLGLEIYDAEEALVAHAAHALTAAEAEAGEARIGAIIENPRRWNGRADPYLYRFAVSLSEDGARFDRVEQPLGIRSIAFDPDEGFFLNGEHLALHGVSRHQDYLGKGWALEPEDHERDMAIIAEMGANTVRFAHYQHAEDWFDLADRYGMAVWAETPFVNKPSFGDAEAAPELIDNARTQTIELIRQNYNHPSVITWGIGNESDIDLAFQRLGPRADARPLLRILNALVKEEDPSRPTVYADCCEATPGEKADYLPIPTDIADLAGYNRYYGWYYGEVGDLGPHLDMLHERHPDLPLSVSEYGVGGALTQHHPDPANWEVVCCARPHPEEYQSWWHEQTWPQIRARRYLWASWIWNMFDFSSPVRQEGDAMDINDKGLVSYDRKVKKDAFYYYKAQWSDEPVLYITSRRFKERKQAKTKVKVYSNAPFVELSLNGEDIGTVECLDRICERSITLSTGVNRVAAGAEIGGANLSDSVEWTLAEQ